MGFPKDKSFSVLCYCVLVFAFFVIPSPLFSSNPYPGLHFSADLWWVFISSWIACTILFSLYCQDFANSSGLWIYQTIATGRTKTGKSVVQEKGGLASPVGWGFTPVGTVLVPSGRRRWASLRCRDSYITSSFSAASIFIKGCMNEAAWSLTWMCFPLVKSLSLRSI